MVQQSKKTEPISRFNCESAAST